MLLMMLDGSHWQARYRPLREKLLRLHFRVDPRHHHSLLSYVRRAVLVDVCWCWLTWCQWDVVRFDHYGFPLAWTEPASSEDWGAPETAKAVQQFHLATA